MAMSWTREGVPASEGWRRWVFRLFTSPRPAMTDTPCSMGDDLCACRHEANVPHVSPDPDKDRMRDALRKLDVDVELLRRGYDEAQRG